MGWLSDADVVVGAVVSRCNKRAGRKVEGCSGRSEAGGQIGGTDQG